MGEEKRVSIFELYARNSEPIKLVDNDGNSVDVYFTKRTEASRRHADDYSRQKNRAQLDNIAERKRELTDITYSGLDKSSLVEGLMVFKESQARIQGLDLFDNLSADEPDAPETAKEADELREERLQEWLKRHREKYEEQEEPALRVELAETQSFHEYSIKSSLDHLDMTIVETLHYCGENGTDGDRVFETIEQLEEVHPRLLGELHDKLRDFLAPEAEVNARRLANDPNLSTPAE